MAAVGKGPHFLQKNSPAEFSGYGPECYYKVVFCFFGSHSFPCQSLLLGADVPNDNFYSHS